MPEALEKALKIRAKQMGLKGRAADRYVYGSLRKTGWKPEREKLHRKKK
jgi:hypothetical protein